MFKKFKIPRVNTTEDLNELFNRISLEENFIMANNNNQAQPVMQNPNLNLNQNPNFNQNQNKSLTVDVKSRLIDSSNANLRTQISTLQAQLTLLTTPSSVESYKP